MEADVLKKAFDDELDRFLSTRRALLPEALPMIDELARLLAAGGKRLRPAFCYWGFRAGGGEHDGRIVRAAAALELLHTFAIVHDDIMDSCDTRRGQPTVHAALGLNVAILVGDLALVLADTALAESGFEGPVLAEAQRRYNRMRQEVIAGQFLEDGLASKPVDESIVLRVAELKSGFYSVMEPLSIGLALAGVPMSEQERRFEGLLSFGGTIGVAFQLRDDLLGTFGDPETTGKPSDSDMREGKRNLLHARASVLLEGSEEGGFFERRWGGENLTIDEVTRLRSLIESSGARAAIEETLEAMRARALDRLGSLDVGEDVRAALTDLAFAVTERQL